MDGEKGQPPLSISEAARRLGVSDQAARAAVLRGELEAFRVGKFWRIHPGVERKLRGPTTDGAA
jgi:excisionase family DNA binding protein